MSDMTVTLPEEQYEALENAAEEGAEEEWYSDWAAIFWCIFFLALVIAGCGIAAWQPWI